MLSKEEVDRLNVRISQMETTRSPWVKTWGELSDYFLPRRYPWLQEQGETKSAAVRNTKLLSSVSLTALRTLAIGMMNGITSPLRPWFSLHVSGAPLPEWEHPMKLYLEECARRMHRVMAKSNFYSALGTLYTELPCFGTASMGIYEDPNTVFRCYNDAIGEFYIDVDYRREVNRHARRFRLTTEQIAGDFGEAALPRELLSQLRSKDQATTSHEVRCMLEPNEPRKGRRSAPWREIYWLPAVAGGHVLRISYLDEFPRVCPRWDTYAYDIYGSSPCMDALPDVKQLQHLILRKGQGLDKVLDPPMLFSSTLTRLKKTTHAGGETYVPGNDLRNLAAPLYQVQLPYQEMIAEHSNLEFRIKQVLYNDLFRMISDIETVRSATEIDARREEKLVLLGPVLDRFQGEALTPAISRIFRICERAGLFPEPPPFFADLDLKIQYEGILSQAQRAVGTAAIERYLQIVAGLAPVFQEEVLDVPNADEILREYGDAIGLPTKLQRSREEVEGRKAQRAEAQALQQAAAVAPALAQGAESLSNTDVGGGRNALQAMIGV